MTHAPTARTARRALLLAIPLQALALGGLLAGCTTQARPATEAQTLACPVAVTALVYPHPVYPEFEAANGYEDRCLVRFDIDRGGVPLNPEARCTYKAFAQSAEAAMLGARFDRKEAADLPNGAQCATFNIEYSIEPAPEPQPL